MNDIYVVMGGKMYRPTSVEFHPDGEFVITTNGFQYIPGEIMLKNGAHIHVGASSKPKTNGISIKNVIFNPPATIVFWSDDTKSIVKAQNGEDFDPEKGLAMAILKRIAGNKGRYYNDFAKWCKNYKPDEKMEILNIDPLSSIAEAFKKISDAIGKSNSINSILKDDDLLKGNLKSE